MKNSIKYYGLGVAFLFSILFYASKNLDFFEKIFLQYTNEARGSLADVNCTPITVPFVENFDVNSGTVSCWTVLDGNNDGSASSNKWRLFNSPSFAYNGVFSYYFVGTANVTKHDDWIVSPQIKMDSTATYKLSYYYRTNALYDNEVEVALSTSGADAAGFTTVLDKKTVYENGTYKKKTIYFKNIKKDAHIGWHITSAGATHFYLDEVSLEKVDCIGPDEDVRLLNVTSNQVSATWNDGTNNQWEVFINDAGSGLPKSSGTLTSSKSTTLTKKNSDGTNLQPGMEYEFYVRSRCGVSGVSAWIGPFYFKTLCIPMSLPFWEGFNTNSNTLSCWSILDNNGDDLKPVKRNVWQQYNFNMYEGDRCMYFIGNDVTNVNLPHNDWMVSPTFILDVNKFYRLKYHYRANVNKNDFRVLMSTSGIDVEDFQKTLIERVGYSGEEWKEETIIIGKTGGTVNFGWQLFSNSVLTNLYIDNVFFEEVVGCPEPYALDIKDKTDNGVTIFWNEEYGVDWEYVVQEKVGIVPTISGTKTDKREVVIKKDKNGINLKPNTEYEYFVRTRCKDGSYSVWAGPFVFRTDCGVFTATPFFEHFNVDSETIRCWTIVDANGDATSSSAYDIWKPFAALDFVGSRAMRILGLSGASDDWLISPRLDFKINKIYRLKYKYKTDANSETNFEVLGSNKGLSLTEFKKVIVPDSKYKTGVYKEDKVFITNFSGEVNLAWRTFGSGSKLLFIDDVSVEEVVNCPEPLNLEAKDFGIHDATVSWEDDFGATQWEVYTQEEGLGVPISKGVLSNSKELFVTKDAVGVTLKGNTAYESYVRTVCKDGSYSIWAGPIVFMTLCDTVSTPFWEGFNSDSKTARCWSFIDDKNDISNYKGSWRLVSNNQFEGNGGVSFSGPSNNDWLVSPTVSLDGGLYMLKYHSKSNADFEILLSNSGVDVKNFNIPVSSVTATNNGKFNEEVAYINGVTGDVNIAWRSKNNGGISLFVDNLYLKKIESCQDPYGVKVSSVGTTSFDVSWKQDGGVNDWEVIVVDYGMDETATPVVKLNVSGVPEVKITGLTSGKSYTVFVRAKCSDGVKMSDWGTPVDVGNLVDINNNCDGAFEIPVNYGKDCEKRLGAAFNDTKVSVISEPSCGSAVAKRDIWFYFIATNKAHILEVSNWKNLIDASVPVMFNALYDQPCTGVGANAIECFNFSATVSKKVFKNLIPGNKYYVRIATTVANVQGVFNLCVTTPDYLDISPSGEKYTIEELVKDVLVDSDCNLVSNVSYQNGDGGTKAMSYNTVGYFNKDKTDFPFDEGVILSTNEIQYAYGPVQETSRKFRGNNNERWIGDKDINDVIAATGAAPAGVDKKRVTQLEFDFIPVSDSISFEYLFASNSYYSDCNSLGCSAAALFAAWLIDTTTGEGQNLARIKNTELPIALNTIMNPIKTGKIQCPGSYSELYWKHYTPTQDSPFDAYIDFVGLTKPMKSEEVAVVPGRKYHIKLAVIDFCAIVEHSSAVLFNSGSFNLGNIDLGEDMMVENNTALCANETFVLDSRVSQLGELDVKVSWFKDGVLLSGENGTTLNVTKAGLYKVVVDYIDIECQRTDEKLIEIYPAISSLIEKPETIYVCKNSLNDRIVNIDDVVNQMFSKVSKDLYDISYHGIQEDAQQNVNPLSSEYMIESDDNHNLYIRIVDINTGCLEIIVAPIVIKNGESPDEREDVVVCMSYEFPPLESNQFYYSKPYGKGIQYQAGDTMSLPGEHFIYVLQKNGDLGCYEEVSYKVSITEGVKAEVFEDLLLNCSIHVLAPLPKYNKYFTESGGNGDELIPGQALYSDQTIFVFAESTDGVCVDESSYVLKYEDCPIQKGISPNGDGVNDSFDLRNHAVQSLKIYNRYGIEVFSYGDGYTNEWHGQDKNNSKLPDGTYYYVVVSRGKVKSGWVQING